MALVKVKKTFQIDSADRDTTKYPTNGDYVVYLPRIYKNITSLRLKGGEFSPLYLKFSESTIPGAIVWLDGSNEMSITTSGGYVTAITDLSGQNTFTPRPNTLIYNKPYLNLPVSINNTIPTILSSYVALKNDNTTSYSVFSVFKIQQYSSYQKYIIDCNEGSGALQVLVNNLTHKIDIVTAGTGTLFSSAATIDQGKFYLLGIVKNGSTISLYINGVADSSSPSANVTSNGNTVIGLSQVSPNGVEYIGEFIIYNSALSSFNLTNIQNYLLFKWNIIQVNDYQASKIHNYVNGYDITNDTNLPSNTYYLLMELEGLNKSDEARVGGDKSAFVDKYFAKIPATANTSGLITYNDKNLQENVATYTPAIGELDRLHIKTRTHAQQDGSGFIYFSNDYNLTFEIEYMDN